MHQLPTFEVIGPKIDLHRLTWTKRICNSKINVCFNFKNDTEKLNNVVYRYPNVFYLQYKEVFLKMTENLNFQTEQRYLLS